MDNLREERATASGIKLFRKTSPAITEEAPSVYTMYSDPHSPDESIFIPTAFMVQYLRSDPRNRPRLRDTENKWHCISDFIMCLCVYLLDDNIALLICAHACNAQGAGVVITITLTLIFGYALLLLELTYGQISNHGPAIIFMSCPIIQGLGFSMALAQIVFLMFNGAKYSFDVTYLLKSLVENTPDYYIFNSTTEDSGPANYFKYLYTSLEELSGKPKRILLAFSAFGCWLPIFCLSHRIIDSKCKVLYLVIITIYLTTLVIMAAANLALPGGVEFIKTTFKFNMKVAGYKGVSLSILQVIVSLRLGGGMIMYLSSMYHGADPWSQWHALAIVVFVIIKNLLFDVLVFATVGAAAVRRGVHFQNITMACDAGLSHIHTTLGAFYEIYPLAVEQFRFRQFWNVIIFLLTYIIRVITSVLIMRWLVGILRVLVFVRSFTRVHANLCLASFFTLSTICIFSVVRIGGKAHSGSRWAEEVTLFRFYESLKIFGCVHHGKPFWNVWVEQRMQWGWPVLCILEVIGSLYIFGVNTFCEDVQLMVGYNPNWFDRFVWLSTPPTLLVAVIINMYETMERRNLAKYISELTILIIILLPTILGMIGSIVTYSRAGKLKSVVRNQKPFSVFMSGHHVGPRPKVKLPDIPPPSPLPPTTIRQILPGNQVLLQNSLMDIPRLTGSTRSFASRTQSSLSLSRGGMQRLPTITQDHLKAPVLTKKSSPSN